MKTASFHCSGRLQLLAGGLLVMACVASTGCQIDVAGQTLPSPYHLTDDVQYYAPGPEFKLSNEAAALAEQRAAELSEPQAGVVPAPTVRPLAPGAAVAAPPAAGVLPPGAPAPAGPAAVPPAPAR